MPTERLKTAPNKNERLETLSTNISIQLIFSAFVSFIAKEFQQFISLLCALVIASLVSGWCGLALLLELGVFMRKTFIIWKCILFFLTFVVVIFCLNIFSISLFLHATTALSRWSCVLHWKRNICIQWKRNLKNEEKKHYKMLKCLSKCAMIFL